MDRKQTANSDTDQLTGLYTRSAFFHKAQNIMRQYPQKEFDLIAVDIEHFKLYNDWYGYEEGDRMLEEIGSQLKEWEKTRLCLCGYMGADDFVMIVERDQALIERMNQIVLEFPKKKGQDQGFLPAFGIYPILDRSMPIAAMYDCAMIAVHSVRGNYACRTAVYDHAMKASLEEGQVLLREITRALQKDELIFYLQPICNMRSGKIVGLESLVRWEHPQKGLILPSDFIPILEEHGFIAKVDRHMWEKACIALSNWIQNGHKPVPMSVNVSRMDIYAMDLPETFKLLADRYQIPPGLLEIEITESAYMEDYELISEVVRKLRSYGFLVFMDDFGSGYSSLNMLRDIKVDALKVDTKFLDMNPESIEHGARILEAVVNIANLMNMKLIAEGVENAEQARFLREIGCLYAQGYYYYKPMPMKDMERILSDEGNIDFKGIEPREYRKLSVSDLCNRNVISEQMLNNMLGGVGFYDLYQGQLELLRVNEQYFQVTGTDPVELEENKRQIIHSVIEEDREQLIEVFAQARENRNSGTAHTVHRINNKKELVWLQARIFFLREQDGHQLFYASLQNITEQKNQEKALEDSQHALQSMLGLIGYNESFLKMAEENKKIAANIFSQMIPCGMIGGYCQDGFPLYFANDEMVNLMGYESYQDMRIGIGGKVINSIYEEDRRKVMEDLGDSFQKGQEYTARYRTVRKDGSLFWTLDKGKVVEAEDGRLAIVSACIDISETMVYQEKLQQLNQRLQEKNLELNYLTDDQPGGYHRCANTIDFDFLYLGNRFLEMFGYTRQQVREIFKDKFIRMVHPDDRELITKAVKGSRPGNIHNLEYRMLSKEGYIWVADQTKMVEVNGEVFFYGVLLDITGTVKIKEQIEKLHRQNSQILGNILEKSTYILKANLTEDIFILDENSEKWFEENQYVKSPSFSEVVNNAVHQVVLPEFKERIRRFLDRKALIQNYKDGVQNQAAEYQRLYKGNPCWMQVIYHLMRLDDTGDIYIYFYTVNIDKQKTRERELTQRAEYDALTGLYNRQTAFLKIRTYLEKEGKRSAAVIMFDLDNFKNVNDEKGHVYGDEVLTDMACRLKGYFRKEDIVCRLGGDEFLVLCQDIEEEALQNKLGYLVEELVHIYQARGTSHTCSISAGYAMVPQWGRDLQELYKKADTALFQAKRAGRRKYKAYREDA